MYDCITLPTWKDKLWSWCMLWKSGYCEQQISMWMCMKLLQLCDTLILSLYLPSWLLQLTWYIYNQVKLVGRVQYRQLTALIECLTALLEYIDILWVTEHTKHLGRQSIKFGQEHSCPNPPLITPLLAHSQVTSLIASILCQSKICLSPLNNSCFVAFTFVSH